MHNNIFPPIVPETDPVLSAVLPTQQSFRFTDIIAAISISQFLSPFRFGEVLLDEFLHRSITANLRAHNKECFVARFPTVILVGDCQIESVCNRRIGIPSVELLCFILSLRLDHIVECRVLPNIRRFWQERFWRGRVPGDAPMWTKRSDSNFWESSAQCICLHFAYTGSGLFHGIIYKIRFITVLTVSTVHMLHLACRGDFHPLGNSRCGLPY